MGVLEVCKENKRFKETLSNVRQNSVVLHGKNSIRKALMCSCDKQITDATNKNVCDLCRQLHDMSFLLYGPLYIIDKQSLPDALMLYLLLNKICAKIKLQVSITHHIVSIKLLKKQVVISCHTKANSS